MEPSHWRFDPQLQGQIDPRQHPELLGAIERLWSSEVGTNCMTLALHRGVEAAIQTAMSAAIVFVLANEDFSKWRTHTDLEEVARAVEGLRERRDHQHRQD